ncbi:hypothetical protein Lgra_0228 [Legionella gratiana]|uniref:Uncharacterized protein n=1 Tax=Legionella gratiana TaxID=45066 RepID=A0A378JDX1_9GAMM|nr:hypothetical protein [Legionella gratiana]KTD15562.1 hypothetical protein Lgra_0228 [Legionella gratiana]STX45077.1 Uncharacterised protein [Legionella gratiana]
MSTQNRFTKNIKRGISALCCFLLSSSLWANDLLVKALDGDVKDTLGSDAKFWTVFILVDIVLATCAAVATKNPKVFLSVFLIAFIPGFLVKTFVF